MIGLDNNCLATTELLKTAEGNRAHRTSAHTAFTNVTSMQYLMFVQNEMMCNKCLPPQVLLISSLIRH